MNGVLRIGGLLGGVNVRAMAGPVFILLVLAMMVLPLPPFILDVLFTFNIAFSIMVLLVAVNTRKPLDFIAFPTILLLTTLLRLSLNIASTRVVLLEGHNGPDAAGKVIEAFGHFLVGGNYTVGIVVFVIMIVINFVVITKGAGRIAEVSARFTLDAMPGKQMAIDADLNAGLIGEDEARRRRKEITQEAEFYGSMDGASKFVRGDAVAGIVILVINIVGGLIIGVAQHGLDLGTAATNYSLLAIGDGLVAQIPALVISTAAGLVVSRVGTDQGIGEQVVGELFAAPEPLALTGVILATLGLIPGMPHIVFLLLAGVAGACAWYVRHRLEMPPGEPVPAEADKPAAGEGDVGWGDVAPLDTLALEIGYRLVSLVDARQEGDLTKRIKAIRRKFAQDVGFLPPPIHIRDNLAELRPTAYRVLLRGVEIATADVYPGLFMAIDPGRVTARVAGMQAEDPAFGLPAVWIEAKDREMAVQYGYTVVDAPTVVATHLSQIMQRHAADLLGRQETQSLIEHLGKDAPKLVEDVVPKIVPLATVTKVLRLLLDDSVPIRDLRTILEALAEHHPRTQDAAELVGQVRIALGRSIVQQLFPGSAELSVMALDPMLERVLLQAVNGTGADAGGIEPGLAASLLDQARACAETQEAMGLPPVLLAPAALRALLARFLKRAVPGLRVLSHAEVPDSKAIRVTAVLGGQGA
jgi:flagellar biosynthesis protein FlhA